MIGASVRPASAAPAGRRLEVTDASLEWMKWLAVVGMVLDHVNWFFFASSIDNPQASPHAWMNDVGRVVFPLFAFVFGVNLARALDAGSAGDRAPRFRRMLLRLVIAGAIAQGAYWLLRGYFFPLNVLFTFALVALVARGFASDATSTQKLAAVALFAFGGLAVEYWWIGAGLALAALYFARRHTVRSALPFVVVLVLLAVMSQNPYPLAALMVIAALRGVRLALPRWPGAFHAYYAGHLWLLVGASALNVGP
jgi:uncharacterized membrane protein